MDWQGFLTVVILNYNCKEYTINCINSISAAGLPLSSIILVDNGSSDGSINLFYETFGSNIQIIGLQKNLGYAEGNNAGIRIALSKKAEWILVLNNDTIVDRYFFSELLKATLEFGNKYQLFSPMILYLNKEHKVAFLGDQLIGSTLLTSKKWEGKGIPSTIPRIMNTDFVHGSGMLIHRNVFEKVGFLDSNFFMYFEEVDFCWRARLAGMKMAVFPSAIMWHMDLGSNRKHSPRTHYLRIRNHIWVFRRYSKGIILNLMFAYSVFNLLRTISKDLTMGDSDLISHAFRGWIDGWFSRLPAW